MTVLLVRPGLALLMIHSIPLGLAGRLGGFGGRSAAPIFAGVAAVQYREMENNQGLTVAPFHIALKRDG